MNTTPQTQEWLRALKAQAQQIIDRNKARVARGAVPQLHSISAEETLRLIELIQPQPASTAAAPELGEALELCATELATLVARLPEPYRGNVRASLVKARAALAKAGMPG